MKLDPEPKLLKNAWIDFLNDKYDFKLKGMGMFSNKELLYAVDVAITKLSANKMDFNNFNSLLCKVFNGNISMLFS